MVWELLLPSSVEWSDTSLKTVQSLAFTVLKSGKAKFNTIVGIVAAWRFSSPARGTVMPKIDAAVAELREFRGCRAKLGVYGKQSVRSALITPLLT